MPNTQVILTASAPTPIPALVPEPPRPLRIKMRPHGGEEEEKAVAESPQFAKVGRLEAKAPSLGDSLVLNWEEVQKAVGHF